VLDYITEAMAWRPARRLPREGTDLNCEGDIRRVLLLLQEELKSLFREEAEENQEKKQPALADFM
jgi:hypothetical protein